MGNGRPEENCENSDPNVSTPPPISHNKSVKEALKSSADHKMSKMALGSVNETPKLKNTRSAKNLLGRDIFNHITEFCNELKKLTIRAAKDKECEVSVGTVNSGLIKHMDNDSKHQDAAAAADVDEVVRTPLLGIRKEKFGSGANSAEKLRRKK